MSAVKHDPWAKPNKVHDANAERLLGEVLASIRDLNGRQVELESALSSMAQRLADSIPKPEPVDLTPIVTAIEQMAKRPVEVKAPAQSVEARGIVDELRQVVAEVGIRPTQWDNLVERITDAVRPQGTMVLGGGGREVQVKDASQTIVNPATEETLATVFKTGDPLAAGTNMVGRVQLDQAASHFVSSSGSLKVEQGRFFIGGAAIDLGGLASSDRAAFRLANPVGSGKNVYVMAVTIYSTITQQVRYNEDGTITADGTVTPRNLNRALGASTPSSVVDLTWARTAITGGTDWPNESRVIDTSPLSLNFSASPIKLGPGKALLVRGTIGDAQTFTVNGYWIEEPV